jgi:hypothetical protein
MAGSGTSASDTVVPATIAATGTAEQGEDAAVSVTGHLKDSHYWHGPPDGPGSVGDGRMEMSDERLSGEVTFIYSAEIFKTAQDEMFLYWGTMVIANDGGTWEGTHFAADHHARPGIHGPLVMQLSGSGG